MAVIPAKARIHSANLRKYGANQLDSRFRGNDCHCDGIPTKMKPALKAGRRARRDGFTLPCGEVNSPLQLQPEGVSAMLFICPSIDRRRGLRGDFPPGAGLPVVSPFDRNIPARVRH